jgi:hypothetical protein
VFTKLVSSLSPQSAGEGMAGREGSNHIIDMNAIALGRPALPLSAVRRLVWLGLLAAFVFALSADVQQFEASKECQGAFNSAFSRGFDIHRCKMTIKAIGADFKFSVPLP